MLAKRFLARVPRVKTSSAAFAQLRAFSTSTGGDSAQEESVRTHTLASVNYPAFWTAPTKPCPSQDPFAAPHYREYNFVTYPVLAEPHEWSLPIRHKLSCEETYDVPMIEGAHQMVNKRQHIKARIDINTADLDPVFTPYQKEIFIKLAGRRYHAPSSKIVIASREMPGLIVRPLLPCISSSCLLQHILG